MTDVKLTIHHCDARPVGRQPVTEREAIAAAGARVAADKKRRVVTPQWIVELAARERELDW